MTRGRRHARRLAVCCAAGASLVGCGPGGGTRLEAGLSAGLVAALQSVASRTVRLSIDGEAVAEVTPDDRGHFTAELSVAEGTHGLRIDVIATSAGGPVRVATTQRADGTDRPLDVVAGEETVARIALTDYSYALDDDADGFRNVHEVLVGTHPLDAASRPTPEGLLIVPDHVATIGGALDFVADVGLGPRTADVCVKRPAPGQRLYRENLHLRTSGLHLYAGPHCPTSLPGVAATDSIELRAASTSADASGEVPPLVRIAPRDGEDRLRDVLVRGFLLPGGTGREAAGVRVSFADDVALVANHFADTTTTGDGGAVLVRDASSVRIEHNIFRKGKAGRGAGVLFLGDAGGSGVVHNTFYDNDAAEAYHLRFEGALRVSSNIFQVRPTPVVPVSEGTSVLENLFVVANRPDLYDLSRWGADNLAVDEGAPLFRDAAAGDLTLVDGSVARGAAENAKDYGAYSGDPADPAPPAPR